MSNVELQDVISPTAPVVLAADHELDHALASPGTQAVFIRPSPPTAWQDELRAAVESGAFRLPRTEVTAMGIDTMATWLDRSLPRGCISRDTRDALLSDILNLFHLQDAISGTRGYRLRIFTEAPTRRCGFHVDTVQPGLPVWGLLRVYNGAGTDWVDPRSVKSMAAFYGWLQERDSVARRYAGEPAARDTRLETLDSRPEFLADAAAVQRVPAGTTVVFRHLDASRHWSDHPPELAWIHGSPMSGRPRLVVNINAHRPMPGRSHSSNRACPLP